MVSVFHPYDWYPLHGDTEATPPVAVLTRDGAAVDLEQWTIRAQVRDRVGNLVLTFAPGVGIVLGQAEARFAEQGRPPVVTSTVALRLRAQDWATIPRRLRGGRYDVEVSRAGTVRTVTGGAFDVTEDVTHG